VRGASFTLAALLLGSPVRAADCAADQRAMDAKVMATRDPAALWRLETRLIPQAERPECAPPAVEEGRPAPALTPAGRITAPVQRPVAPTGPGVMPWILIGASAALAGGAVYVDYAANDVRDALESAQAAGDQDAFNRARGDFDRDQRLARGLAVGAAAALVGGVVWALVGGEDDPVQTRPIFQPAFTGVGGRF